MTKLNRVTGKIFGETASPIDDPILGPAIGQFGSAKAGTYIGTDDIATIQSLPAWSNGWIDAVTPTNQYPALPERTGVDKVLSYQQNYILQRGVPEWDENTDYYENCFCSYNGAIYRSIVDDNTGNQPDDKDYWELYGAIDDYANQDLTNLTALGNARLQFAPFSINQGTVLNGENNTLTMPADAQSTVTVYGTVEGYGRSASNSSGSVTRTLDEPTLIEDVTATYIIYPGYNSTVSCSLTAILDDDSTVTIRSYTYSQYSRRVHTETYTFPTPTLVKAFTMAVSVSGNGSASISDISYSSEITVSAGTSIICDPCTITTCDGRTKVDSASAVYSLDGEADGSYSIFKNYTDGTLSLASSLRISKTDGKPWTQPVLTANGTMGGSSFAVSASTERSSHYAWHAVDGSTTAANSWFSNEVAADVWYSFYNPTPLNVTGLTFKNYNASDPNYTYCTRLGRVQISDDGVTWTDIKSYTNTVVGNSGVTWSIDLSDNTNYSKYYRIYSDTNASSYGWIITELTITATEATDNWLDISTVPANLYLDGILNNNLVYIGDCTVSGGVITKLKNNKFNMNGYWELCNLPDYNAGISKPSSGFTADEDGWLYMHARSKGYGVSVYKNGIPIYDTALAGSTSFATIGTDFVPVYRGDVITSVINTNGSLELTFYPMRGY